jgi:rhamnose transport system permease protein
MIGRYRRELSVGVAYALILALLAWKAPGFFGARPLVDFGVKNASVLVAAVGMTLVILARQIDISVGSQASLCAVAAGLLARQGLPMPLVALGTLALGAGLGAINGALVAGLGLPSIVVTLATLVILRESLRYLREGEFVRDLPGDFQWFGLGQTAGQWVVIGVAAVVFVLFAWGLRHLAAGRSIYATGSDPEAARLAGIRPRRVIFGVFVAMGALTALYAVLVAIQFPAVDPKTGTGLEMQVIAAVVVGGVAISGGRGRLVGTLIGVALLGTIGPGLVFLSGSFGSDGAWSRLRFLARPEWEGAIRGLIILLAVASDGLARRERN